MTAPIVLDPLSEEARRFFERRTGPPVYQTRIAKTGWPTRCPVCGGPLLMEFTVDDQVGLSLTVEDCATCAHKENPS
jgi:hypothetical protein